MLAGVVHLFNPDAGRTDAVGKGNVGRFSCFYRHSDGVLGLTGVNAVLREKLFHRIVAREQISGLDYAVPVRHKGRALDFSTTRVGDFELPALNAAGAFHGLDDFQLAAVIVGEYNLRTLMGLDLESLDGGVNDPILVVKEAVLVSCLLSPIGAGVQVITRLALLIGDDFPCRLGAGFIRINRDAPALGICAGIGPFHKPGQTLLLVVPFIHRCISGGDGDIVEAQLRQPVIILGGLLRHRIPAQRQVFRAGIAIVIRGIGSNGFAVGITNHKSPAAQVIAGVGGLVKLNAAIAGVDEGELRSLASCHGDGLDL